MIVELHSLLCVLGLSEAREEILTYFVFNIASASFRKDLEVILMRVSQ